MFESISNLIRNLPSTEFFSGAPFWAYFVVVVIGIRLSPVRGAGRDVLLLFANVLMLLALPRFNGTALALYAGLVVFTYGLGRLLLGDSVKTPRYRMGLAVVAIVAVLFVLAIFKYRLLQSLFVRNSSVAGQGAANFIFLIGISYSSFKAIHFIVEAYKRKIEGLRFLEFANYLLFFPSFVSGPINR